MVPAAWDETVEAIYDAAAAPDQWPDALMRIAHHFDARGALILHRDQGGRIGTIVSPTLVEAAEIYDRHWRTQDVRAERVFLALAGGRNDIQTDRGLFSDEEIATLPIFQKFLLPLGFLWGMGVSVSPAPGVDVLLTILRASDRPTYDEADQAAMAAISRHVERSLGLSLRIMSAEAERLGLSEALDRIHCGAFVLDADHRIVFSNVQAQSLLGRGLVVAGGRLKALDLRKQEELAAVIAAVIERPAEEGASRSLLVPSEGGALAVQAMPMRRSLGTTPLGSPGAMVLVTSLEAGQPFDPAILRDVFKLTLGEARLASLVGAGAAPREAAGTLGITEATARAVLGRVFDKMGVSRQGEMAALMGRLLMPRVQ